VIRVAVFPGRTGVGRFRQTSERDQGQGIEQPKVLYGGWIEHFETHDAAYQSGNFTPAPDATVAERRRTVLQAILANAMPLKQTSFSLPLTLTIIP
jgi:hypothetical protein